MLFIFVVLGDHEAATYTVMLAQIELTDRIGIKDTCMIGNMTDEISTCKNQELRLKPENHCKYPSGHTERQLNRMCILHQ